MQFLQEIISQLMHAQTVTAPQRGERGVRIRRQNWSLVGRFFGNKSVTRGGIFGTASATDSATATEADQLLLQSLIGRRGGDRRRRRWHLSRAALLHVQFRVDVPTEKVIVCFFRGYSIVFRLHASRGDLGLISQEFGSWQMLRRYQLHVGSIPFAFALDIRRR